MAMAVIRRLPRTADRGEYFFVDRLGLWSRLDEIHAAVRRRWRRCGRGRRDFDGFVERRERQLLIEHHGLSRTELDVGNGSRLESREHKGDGVGARARSRR